ncbi:3-hydroxyacyl-CoA dehydrogenase family protein [Amycolatopsis pigmentata]|uniref:3-hydroxyacyl-CoA dehydrogenase family protein n=1 Tax=Amycolatopsis pigmentata TaxID=450801 RepID=A0ABW5FMR8_9PSEU
MTTAASDETDHLVIIGAGVLGCGIAALALAHGVAVTLADHTRPKLDQAEAAVTGHLKTATLLGVCPEDIPHGRLDTTTGLEEAVARRPAAVIEAGTEDSILKAGVLAQVGPHVPEGTPLISNTSSVPVDELADAVPRPEDLLGAHFMDPPYLIATVEVIPGRRTGAGALSAAKAFLGVLRRTSILVRDSPGFVTSRLLHPMINDAARLVQEGVASAEDVDALMCGCLGHPSGPLRTADLIGIDNLADSLWVLHKRTGDERSRPCDLLLAKVRDGHHGRKSGRGFYDYAGGNSVKPHA